MATKKAKLRLLLLAIAVIFKRTRRQRRFWVQSPNLFRLSCAGGYTGVIDVYRESHPDLYSSTFRMPSECFDRILHLVSPYITKQDYFPSGNPC